MNVASPAPNEAERIVVSMARNILQLLRVRRIVSRREADVDCSAPRKCGASNAQDHLAASEKKQLVTGIQ